MPYYYTGGSFSFQAFFAKNRSDFSDFSEKFLLPAGTAGLIQLGLNENNVRADTADLLPRDNIVISAAEQAEQAARHGHDERGHAAALQIDHVRHAAEPAAVADIDDLAAAQRGKPVFHRITCPISSATLYAAAERNMQDIH